jgi:hypothetical protein
MKQRIKIKTVPTTVNLGNLLSRLRRMRAELATMLQQVDECLARIEQERTA